MEYKLITLQDDCWSESLKNYIRSLAHYKTVLLWENKTKVELTETPYYLSLLKHLKVNGQVWGGILKTEQDVLKQTKSFFEMYQICPNWATDTTYKFKINHRVCDNKDWYFGYYPVQVHNNGELELYDARHRLAILMAKNLELPQLTLCKREIGWQKIYDDILTLYPNKHLYQPIMHPDFQEFNQGRTVDKEIQIESIVKQYKINSVIDLGICHGYTLYSLRNVLKSAIGIEYNQERYAIARIVLEACAFQCYHSDILDYLIKNPKPVNCIFALAVFHHFLKQNSMWKFNELLKHIAKNTKYLLYEIPNKTEPRFEWIPKELQEDFNEHIQKKMDFAEIFRFIHNGKDVILLKKNGK